MLTIRAFVAFRQTEIYNIDSIFGFLIATNQKVIRLDITMDYPLFMYNFDSLDHLSCYVEHRL